MQVLLFLRFCTFFEYDNYSSGPRQLPEPVNNLYGSYPDGYTSRSLLKNRVTHNNCSVSAYIGSSC